MGKNAKDQGNITEYRNADPALRAAGYVMTGYIYLLVCMYPFIIRPGYAVTSYVKYDFLIGISYGYVAGPVFIPTFVPLSFALILIGTVLYIRNTGKGISVLFRSLRFSITDLMVGLYALFVIISSILSPYKDEIVWGFPSWNMGFASQLLFIYTYFIVSRLFDKESLKNLVYVSLIASAIVFVIGILQRFGLDIFGLYDGIGKKTFISTIGNPNFFSSYMIIFLILGIFAVWISDAKSVMYKTGIVYIVIGSVVLPLQGSDMTYVGLFMAMSFMFVMSFDSLERMKNFLEITLVILLGWRVTGIAWKLSDPEYTLHKLSKFMLFSPYVWIFMILFIFGYVLIRKKYSERVAFDMTPYRRIGTIYAWIVAAVIILIVVYIILNTKKILPDSFRSRDRYLFFNKKWGSGRGAIWHDTMLSYIEEFKEEPVRALFGAGPDQFYHVIKEHAHKWLRKIIKQKMLTNAHNEWLTAFINYGLFGGLSYIGIFISSMIRGIKSRMKSPLATGVVAIVIAYFSHDMFCFQQYVNTPYIFIIIGIGEMLCRNNKKKLRNNKKSA